MAGPAPRDNDGLNVGILRAELTHLRELLSKELSHIASAVQAVDVKVDKTCSTVEELEDKVVNNSKALSLHENRLARVERFQDGLLDRVFKWGSFGAGAVIALGGIVFAIGRAAGAW